MYETNIVAVKNPTYMLSFAWKWLGEKKITTRCLPDYRGYKKNKQDDSALVKELWGVMNEADIIVAHNAARFDNKKSASRFIINGLGPPSPSKTIDTLRIARSNFGFDSNKLNDLATYLGVGKKIPHTGMHLWLSCMAGDLNAWRVMRRYNGHDVRLLEDVYLKLRAWAPNHPNLNLYTGSTACPSCQSTNVQARGQLIAKTRRRQRFQCQSCGNWFSGELIK